MRKWNKKRQIENKSDFIFMMILEHFICMTQQKKNDIQAKG